MEFRQVLGIVVLAAICVIAGLIVRTGPGLRAALSIDVRDHFGWIHTSARLLQNSRDGFEGRAQRRRVADLDDVLEFLQLTDQLFKTINFPHQQ